MSMMLYDKMTFTLDSCDGEAEKLFGDPKTWTKQPRIRFDIAATGDVTFTVFDASPAPGYSFKPENARLLSDGYANWWPDLAGDLIIGHLNYTDATKRQVFFMWVRPTSPLIDPKSYLTLNMYFLKNGSPFDQCPDAATKPPSGIGQDSGGGTGHGPN